MIGYQIAFIPKGQHCSLIHPLLTNYMVINWFSDEKQKIMRHFCEKFCKHMLRPIHLLLQLFKQRTLILLQWDEGGLSWCRYLLPLSSDPTFIHIFSATVTLRATFETTSREYSGCQIFPTSSHPVDLPQNKLLNWGLVEYEPFEDISFIGKGVIEECLLLLRNLRNIPKGWMLATLERSLGLGTRCLRHEALIEMGCRFGCTLSH